MSADSFFRMGHTHSICQDYCVAGVTEEGVSYALLSDGCSDAGGLKSPGAPFTDFGSRFVVRAAHQRVRYISEGAVPLTEIATEAAAMARVARLPDLALNATLLGAIKAPDSDNVLTWMAGDGLILTRLHGGEVCYTALEYEANMPYYPSYLVDPDKDSQWRKYSGKAVARTGIRNAVTKEWQVYTQETVPVPGWLQSFSAKDIDLILLFSDGVTSFYNDAPVDLHAALDQILDFKGGYVGQFLSRRCNSFLTRFCVANNWKHMDDLAVAGLYFGTS